MILALFGGSAVGKTTIATSLASKLSWPKRSCGEEVKIAAREKRVRIVDLSDDVHRKIDRDTSDWVHAHENCIVEGRFLDRVLAKSTKPLLLVELYASNSVRLERLFGRDLSRRTLEDLLSFDREDEAFSSRMYEKSACLAPDYKLDNSNLAIEQCAEKIIELARQSGGC